eukprot:1785338-Amphidinium_carterae.1
MSEDGMLNSQANGTVSKCQKQQAQILPKIVTPGSLSFSNEHVSCGVTIGNLARQDLTKWEESGGLHQLSSVPKPFPGISETHGSQAPPWRFEL